MNTKALAAVVLLTATACAPFGGDQDGPTRSWFDPSRFAPKAVKLSSGAATYTENCSQCHGDRGLGDGRLGSDLPVAPPDLTGLALANGGVYPAEQVMETIHGYPGKFHRGSMPEFGQILRGPLVEWRAPSGEIIMTPKGLLDVVAYVEGLQVGI